MKKSLSTLVLTSIISLFFLSVMMPVLAVDPAPTIIQSPDEAVTLLETITDWFFTILMVVAVIFIILAAWTFLTAGGNPDSVTRARQMLVYALIGVAVAVLAKGLPILVQTLLES